MEPFCFFLQGFAALFRCAFPLSAMAQSRQYCDSYQRARVVKGRPECPYTKHTCPFGMHACQACGLFGHGAEECRHIATETKLEPPPEPPAPPPSSAPPQEIATSSMPDPDRAKATSEPVFVPGFGKKGEGKSANYGTAIPPPTLVDPSDLPEAIRSVSSVLVKEDPCKDDDTPPPIPATTEDVEMWMETGFRKLTNMSTKSPPEVGDSVLWRGVKTGKHGHPSTKCEWFNGKVRYVQVEDNEVFLYID